MINNNILFLITSIFLGFIISMYYSKNNFNFFIYFILISIILYLIFYNLFNSKENFSNITNSVITNSEIINIDGCIDGCYDKNIIRDYLEDYIEEENILNFNLYKNNSMYNKILQNNASLNNASLNNENSIEGTEEETYSVSGIEEENNDLSINNQVQNNSIPLSNFISEEEIVIKQNSVKYENPDLNKILLSNPLPLNINISYNAQNSVNEINNESDKNNGNDKNNLNRNNLNRNLGGNYGDSRININSDWIYGENAWTNYPDYYIPEKNKLIGLNNLKNREIKTPCPLMINTPWSEYLSGDSNLEPYNF